MLRARSRLVDSFTHILRSDPAVDSSREDFDAQWSAYLDGVGEPPLKTGEKPAIWKLRILGTKEQLRLSEHGSRASEDKHTFPGFIAAAFALGVASVDGLVDAAGKTISMEFADEKGIPIVALAWMDYVEPEWVFELGSRVIARMNVSPK